MAHDSQNPQAVDDRPAERSKRPPMPPAFDLAEVWLSTVAALGRSCHTVATYRYAVEELRAWRRGLVEAAGGFAHAADLSNVTRPEARAYVAHLLTRHVPSGANNRLRSLSAFFGWLVAEGEAEASPFKGLRVAENPEPQLVASDEEVEAMLASAKASRRDLALLTLMKTTGCRKGEVAALRFEDIDLPNRLVTFPVSKSRPRIVPLNDDAAQALTRWLRQRGIGKDGSLWSVDDPYSLVGKIVRRHSKGKLTPHSIRRYFAVSWLRKGGTETSLMRLAGWKSSAMILRYSAGAADLISHEEFHRLMAT
jgi:integrase